MKSKKQNLINEDNLYIKDNKLYINLYLDDSGKLCNLILLNFTEEKNDNESNSPEMKLYYENLTEIKNELDNGNFSLIKLIEKNKEIAKKNNREVVSFILTQPEKFGQLILWNYVYYNWRMEKEDPVNNYRYDLHLKLKGENGTEKFISLIEVKDFKNFEDFKNNKEYRRQLKDYIADYSTYIDKDYGNYFGLIGLDCNYLFNNPNIITYISDACMGFFVPLETQKKFISQEIFHINVDANNVTGVETIEKLEEKRISDSGIISYLVTNEKDYTVIPDYKNKNIIRQIVAAALPSALHDLETDTNVRDKSDQAVIKIENSIRSDIERLGSGNYLARASGTGDKHISIKGKILSYKIANNKVIVGLNIDEFNGQHSTSAYYKIELDKNLKLDKEQLLLPIKIFPYENTTDLFKIKQVSNFSVGDTKLEASKQISLLKHINRSMYEIDFGVHIVHPKKREINSTQKNIKISYQEIFPFLDRFLDAFNAPSVYDINSKDLILKKRTKSVTSELTKSIVKYFFYDIKKKYIVEDKRNKSHKCEISKLIEREKLIIEAYANRNKLEECSIYEYNNNYSVSYDGMIFRKDEDDNAYYLYIGDEDKNKNKKSTKDEVHISRKEMSNAKTYLEEYEKELNDIENDQKIKKYNLDLFAFIFHEFIRIYFSEKVISVIDEKSCYEDDVQNLKLPQPISKPPQAIIYLSVFYFAVKKILYKYKDAIDIITDERFGDVNRMSTSKKIYNDSDFVDDFKLIINNYKSLFNFINMLEQDGNTTKVLQSPQEYGLYDYQIEELYNSVGDSFEEKSKQKYGEIKKKLFNSEL